ncbi:MAG: hypothetical protein GX236_00245 [Clostridiaceae bacterium]|nr:hypothetical protein [Clostridiaceae bacterium]
MKPPRRFRDVYPRLYGALIGSALTLPAAALYKHYQKPVNKFASYVGKGIGSLGNYAKRMTQNALSAMWNTPFKEPTPAEEKSNDDTPKPTPNPTPRISSGNADYDRNHKSTIIEKNL